MTEEEKDDETVETATLEEHIKTKAEENEEYEKEEPESVRVTATFASCSFAATWDVAR